MEKYKEELPAWRTKMESAYQELESLKREVNKAKAYQILIVYVKYKDLDMQLAKQTMFNNHVSAINQELVENSDLLRKSFRVACEVLNQAYDRLEDGQVLTPEIQSVYERLQRKMRFAESEANIKMVEMDSLAPFQRLASSKTDEEHPAISSFTGSAKKRVREPEPNDDDLHLSMEEFESQDTDSDSDDLHRTFKRPRNLNETQVLGASNGTYKPVTATVTKPKKMPQHMVTDLLSDQNVRGSNDAMKKGMESVPHCHNYSSNNIYFSALLKSNHFSAQGLKRTLAAASIAKENVKFTSNYVRKSPRALVAKGKLIPLKKNKQILYSNASFSFSIRRKFHACSETTRIGN